MFADERGLITGFVIRMILGMIVAGIVLFDAGAIVVNVFSLDQAATRIVEDLSLQSIDNGIDLSNARLLRRAARKLAAEEGVKLISIERTSSGISLKVRKEASTLIVKRFGATRDWGIATADARASAP